MTDLHPIDLQEWNAIYKLVQAPSRPKIAEGPAVTQAVRVLDFNLTEPTEPGTAPVT